LWANCKTQPLTSLRKTCEKLCDRWIVSRFTYNSIRMPYF